MYIDFPSLGPCKETTLERVDSWASCYDLSWSEHAQPVLSKKLHRRQLTENGMKESRKQFSLPFCGYKH